MVLLFCWSTTSPYASFECLDVANVDGEGGTSISVTVPLIQGGEVREGEGLPERDILSVKYSSYCFVFVVIVLLEGGKSCKDIVNNTQHPLPAFLSTCLFFCYSIGRSPVAKILSPPSSSQPSSNSSSCVSLALTYH